MYVYNFVCLYVCKYEFIYLFMFDARVMRISKNASIDIHSSFQIKCLCTQDPLDLSRYSSTDSGDTCVYHPGDIWLDDINALQDPDEGTRAISFVRSQGNSLLPAAGLQEITRRFVASSCWFARTLQEGACADAGAEEADTAAIGYYSANDDLTFDDVFNPTNPSQSDGAVPAIPRWSMQYLREAISSIAGRNFAPPVLPAAMSCLARAVRVGSNRPAPSVMPLAFRILSICTSQETPDIAKFVCRF